MIAPIVLVILGMLMLFSPMTNGPTMVLGLILLGIASFIVYRKFSRRRIF